MFSTFLDFWEEGNNIFIGGVRLDEAILDP